MSNRLPAWNVKQLEDLLQEDLTRCHTDFERMMCKTIGGKHIRETAELWSKERKLTPAEVAIAQKYGFK